MKKLCFLCIATGMFLVAGPGKLDANSHQPASCISVVFEWKKAKDGAWPGMKDGKTYWYKLKKGGNLVWSTDGKSWAEVPGNAWADKDGKWLKISDGKLLWSKDGNDCAEVPEWKWEASDGKWYKFDKNWGLWVNM